MGRGLKDLKILKISFKELKDFLETIFDKIHILVNYQSGLQPANKYIIYDIL